MSASFETKLSPVAQKLIAAQAKDQSRPDYREPHRNVKEYLDTLTVPELRDVLSELSEETKRISDLAESILGTQQSIRNTTGV